MTSRPPGCAPRDFWRTAQVASMRARTHAPTGPARPPAWAWVGSPPVVGRSASARARRRPLGDRSSGRFRRRYAEPDGGRERGGRFVASPPVAREVGPGAGARPSAAAKGWDGFGGLRLFCRPPLAGSRVRCLDRTSGQPLPFAVIPMSDPASTRYPVETSRSHIVVGGVV